MAHLYTQSSYARYLKYRSSRCGAGKLLISLASPIQRVLLRLQSSSLRCVASLNGSANESKAGLLYGPLGSFFYRKVPSQTSFLVTESSAICSLQLSLPRFADTSSSGIPTDKLDLSRARATISFILSCQRSSCPVTREQGMFTWLSTSFSFIEAMAHL